MFIDSLQILTKFLKNLLLLYKSPKYTQFANSYSRTLELNNKHCVEFDLKLYRCTIYYVMYIVH